MNNAMGLNPISPQSINPVELMSNEERRRSQDVQFKVKAEKMPKKSMQIKSSSVSSFRSLKSANSSMINKIKSPRANGVPLAKKKSDAGKHKKS